MPAELTLSHWVAVLAGDNDLARANEAAIALSKPGATSKASSLPEYATALNRFLDVARDSPDETQRLQALAILARLRKQQNKRFSPPIEQRLAEPMRGLAASPWELGDYKDRNYLAQALRLTRFDDQINYLARFVAGEEGVRSEARDSASITLLEIAPELDDTFLALGSALNAQSHDTKDPANSRAVRMSRVLGSLREAMREAGSAVGPETGTFYASFLRSALGTGIAERSTRITVANAALGVLDAWVRPNFSVARHANTFSAIGVLRRLFLPARWPDDTLASRVSLGLVVREAIHMLAEAGVTDDGLRQTLSTLLEEPAAQAALSKIAQTKRPQPDLPNISSGSIF